MAIDTALLRAPDPSLVGLLAPSSSG